MAISHVLDRTDEGVKPSKHWLARNTKAILFAVAWVLSLLSAVEIGHWLQSGMGFIDHMGHLGEHIWSLVTTGSWEPGHEIAAWMWRVVAAWMW